MADPEKKAPQTGDKQGKKDGKSRKQRKGKTRELVECLLVAGVLALGIRTFAFQIFKIPTRSMEPTLIGNEDYGDRVVAAMWYNRGGAFLPLKLARPDRWEVVVFKHHAFNQKTRREEPTNFIKRLIGLPGERIEIRDGDIWVRKPGEEKAEIQRKPAKVQEQLWTKLCDLNFSAPWRTASYWRTEGFDEEKRILGPGGSLCWADRHRLDNRFIRPTVRDVECPNRGCPGRIKDPGHPDDPGRPFRFRGAFDTARPVVFCPKCHTPVVGVFDDGGEGALVFRATEERPNDYWAQGENAPSVPDLRLALDFEYLTGAGDLVVTLQGRSEPYTFKLPLGRPGAATLEAARIGQPESRELPVARGAPHHLEVVNVDGTFWAALDGVVIGPRQYVPNSKPGNSDASLQVTGGASIALRGIKLYRDIYYGYSGTQMKPFDPNDVSAVIARERDGAGKFEMSTHTSFMQLPDDGYFFLGDNQLASADSREFEEVKREKDIVARGIFVAWPPSRFHLVW